VEGDITTAVVKGDDVDGDGREKRRGGDLSGEAAGAELLRAYPFSEM
jgi:hypothetical protein